MRHVVDPLAVTIVCVLRTQGTDVVGLAVVIPGDNLNHVETLLKDLIPAVVEKRTTRENPVLGVRNLGAKVS